MESLAGQGRARGRARLSEAERERIIRESRRPGDAPPDVQSVLMAGRGRGVSADDLPVQGGRSKPRISQTAVPRVGLNVGMASVTISSSDSDTGSSSSKGKGKSEISSGGDDGNGNGHGSGNGRNGAEEQVPIRESVGRGAKRGKPEPMAIYRTMPSETQTKKGKMGAKVDLSTNYFPLKKVPNWRLYLYRVDMKPDVDYTRERKYHVRQNKDLAGKKYFFDGTMMITTHPLLPSSNERLVFSSKRDSDNQIIEVTIKMVGEVERESSSYLQFMNIMLRGVLEKLSLDKIGRNFYDSKAVIKDPKLVKVHLELYPGYETSIRQHENEIMLCVEISHKVLRTDTVLDMVKKVSERGGVSSEKLDKLLLSQIVITKYNNKTYKISEIRLDMSPKDFFENKKGEKIQYAQYYLDRWGMKITDLDQPLLVSIPREKDMRGAVQTPVFLVPELCNMTGLSDAQRADFNLMKDLAIYTRMEPGARITALNQFAKRIHNAPEIKEMLSAWDLEFGQSLQTLAGRNLGLEEILGSGSSKIMSSNDASWDRAFRNWKCQSSVKLQNWVIIFTKSDQVLVEGLLKNLQTSFTSVGMTCAPPALVPIATQRTPDYMTALEMTTKQAGMQLIMVIVPNKTSSDLYSLIKKKCCVNSPVPSQVVTAPLLKKEKGLQSVATKIALQMNCKLGGELWSVKIPLQHTMVVGFDTYHDSQMSGKSVGALVASTNQTFTQFFSTTEIHSTLGAEEISMKIRTMFLKALTCFKEKNGKFPQRIFFYRDGVGESQIPFVHAHEVKQILKVISDVSPGTMLTFIIVSKRIQSRFFRGTTNPASGTVIDDVVTLPERYDFYLVSQSVRQGTVNPTSYNVIHDESKLDPDKIQKLSYKLCHLYYNWPGTVRVPAPVQYAHKLAYLVGTSIHQEPAEKLSKLLYYL